MDRVDGLVVRRWSVRVFPQDRVTLRHSLDTPADFGEHARAIREFARELFHLRDSRASQAARLSGRLQSPILALTSINF
jgi:hypothetical protein